ncbi:hypothetical protein J6590_048803, partial [Homalodisca vitripennis]
VRVERAVRTGLSSALGQARAETRAHARHPDPPSPATPYLWLALLGPALPHNQSHSLHLGLSEVVSALDTRVFRLHPLLLTGDSLDSARLLLTHGYSAFTRYSLPATRSTLLGSSHTQSNSLHLGLSEIVSALDTRIFRLHPLLLTGDSLDSARLASHSACLRSSQLLTLGYSAFISHSESVTCSARSGSASHTVKLIPPRLV